MEKVNIMDLILRRSSDQGFREQINLCHCGSQARDGTRLMDCGLSFFPGLWNLGCSAEHGLTVGLSLGRVF